MAKQRMTKKLELRLYKHDFLCASVNIFISDRVKANLNMKLNTAESLSGT